MNFNLKTALSTIAPTLATMLGGPLAGTAVTALETALGLAPGAGQDGVTAAVASGMTPETIAAVRAADQKHLEVLGQQGIDLQKLNDDFATSMATVDAGDRDSARKREIAIGGYTTPALAWLVVGGSVALGVTVVSGYVTKDPAMATLVGTVIGYVFGEAKQVLAYYFGSSAGSDRKTELLAQSPAVPKQ
jgi:hypothetical protein